MTYHINQIFNIRPFSHPFKQYWNSRSFLDDIHVQGQLTLIINICNFIIKYEDVICCFDNVVHYLAMDQLIFSTFVTSL
jgi:hypothetical protein